MYPIKNFSSSMIFNNTDNLTTQIDRLTKGLNSQDKTVIIRHIPDLSLQDKLNFLGQVLWLMSDEMDFSDRLTIIKSLGKVPSHQKREELIDHIFTITAGMLNTDRRGVIIRLFKVPLEFRDTFIKQYFLIINEETDIDFKLDILEFLEGADVNDREDLIRLYFHVIKPNMDTKDKLYIFSSLVVVVGQERKEHRETLVLQGLRLFTDDMDAHDRMRVVIALQETDPDSREDLATQTLRLIRLLNRDEINGRERIEILRRLLFTNDIEASITQILPLITSDRTNNMTIEEIAHIIFYILTFSLEEREVVVTQILRVMPSHVTCEDLLRLLACLRMIPISRIDAIVTLAFPLITNMIFEDRLCVLLFLHTAWSHSDEIGDFLYRRLSTALSSLHVIPEEFRLLTTSDEQRLEDIIDIMLKRRRNFITNNRELTETPFKIVLDLYEHLKKNKIKLLPNSIEYTDSEGIDAGGVMRSFVTNLTKALCDPKYSLVTGLPSKVIPSINTDNPSSLSLEDQEKCFTILGRFFSAAMQRYQSIVVGQYFHPIVFKMLFALTPEDLEMNDSSEVFDKMLKIYIRDHFNATEEIAQNLVENNITEDFRDIYCIESRDQFIKENKIDEKIKAILLIAKSIYDSLSSKTRWVPIKGTSPDVLREKIEGILSKDTIQNALQMDERDQPHPTSVEYLKKWITGTDSQMLQKFIEAISGMKSLDPAIKLNMAGITGINTLPKFHTCVFRIDLSQYSSYEIFKEKLEMSLDYCLAGSGFQMA